MSLTLLPEYRHYAVGGNVISVTKDLQQFSPRSLDVQPDLNIGRRTLWRFFLRSLVCQGKRC